MKQALLVVVDNIAITEAKNQNTNDRRMDRTCDLLRTQLSVKET